MPAVLTVMELQDGNPILSRVQVKLARPEVASDAEPLKETGLRYQPFAPVVPENVPVILGNFESTLVDKDPISDVSPHEESAQYVKLLLPSPNGTLHVVPAQAKDCPFNVPSMARML